MVKLNSLSGFGSGAAAAAGVAGNAYFLGGHRSGVEQVLADKLVFATDTTTAVATANLNAGSMYSGFVSDASTSGYVAGGTRNAGAITDRTEKLVYATDTTAAEASADLTIAIGKPASTSDGLLAGYISGGYSDARISSTDKLVYATDTTAAEASADLTRACSDMAGVSSASAGYIGGGDIGTEVYTAVVDKLVFATDTTAAEASANLDTGTATHAGCSGDGVAGYFSGGYHYATGSQDRTEKLVYATDTTATVASAALTSARYGMVGASDGSVNGYFAGGAATIEDIEILAYATDVMSATVASRDLPTGTGRTNLSALSSVSR